MLKDLDLIPLQHRQLPRIIGFEGEDCIEDVAEGSLLVFILLVFILLLYYY